MDRTEQKRQTRQKIIEAAGRGFRRGGFGGAGVDGMAKEAGVTSGAFYVHFRSKSDAFVAAIEHGLEELRSGIVYFQRSFGERWWSEFVRYYLSEKRSCDLANTCALQSLSSEVARGSADDRAAFERGAAEVVQVMLDGPVSAGAPRSGVEAWLALSQLVGGVTMARAIEDPALANEIALATIEKLTAE
jgi:AcrR family transcriptional regulator